MVTFEYRGYDAAGRVCRGLVEAEDLKQAREKLAATGVLTEWAAAAGASRRRRRRRLTLERRIEFFQELSALLNGGWPLVSALDILIQSQAPGAWRPALAAARDAIRAGAPLASALAGAVGNLAPQEQALLAAGERAGALGQALDNLAGFLEAQRAWQEKVATALIYPVILLGLALAIAGGLLGLVVPRYGQLLLEQGGVPVPLLTACLLRAGRLAAAGLLPVLGLAALLAALAARRARRDPAWRRDLNRRCFSLPLVGRGCVLLASLRFAHALAMLLRGGVALVDGLALAGAAAGSSWVAFLAAREAESMRHGASLAEALRRIPPLADTLAAWVQVGAAGGDLEAMLDHAARRLQRQWERYLARRLALLEPALIILVGGFVLLVVLAVLLPIIALNKALM